MFDLSLQEWIKNVKFHSASLLYFFYFQQINVFEYDDSDGNQDKLEDLKNIVDGVNDEEWPTLNKADTAVPIEQLREETRQRWITLTLIKQLAELMSKLKSVAETHRNSFQII